MDEHFRATLDKTVLKLNADYKEEMRRLDKVDKTLKVVQTFEKKVEKVEKLFDHLEK